LWRILYYIVSMQTETLSLRITKAESRALRERARREGISRGSLVRRALRAYGVTPPADGTSGYEVIKHLIGRNAGGPKDLSADPRHLDDYGQ
jgi:Ribbon-helix-helix protein, copG family